jgi:hypothetical protein
LSLQVRIQRRGTDLNIIPDKIGDAIVPGFVNALADFAFAAMYQNAPWRSGFLAMSISKEVHKDGFVIKPNVSYAAFVEKGTSPHLILPLSASCLAFESGTGETVFASFVFHPGTKPNPFVNRSANETRVQAAKIFDDVWKQEVK